MEIALIITSSTGIISKIIVCKDLNQAKEQLIRYYNRYINKMNYDSNNTYLSEYNAQIVHGLEEINFEIITDIEKAN